MHVWEQGANAMKMNWLKILPIGLLWLAACANLPFFGKRKSLEGTDVTGGAQEQPRVQLEFDNIQYDGETLSGRLLVGVTEGRLRLNRQLRSTYHAEIRFPADCKTGRGVAYINADSFSRQREEDLLILESGHWYGKVIHYPLLDEHFTGLGPECLKAEIWLFSFDGELVARQEVRAERPARPSPDAGTPEASSDAGGWDVNFTGQRAEPSAPR